MLRIALIVVLVLGAPPARAGVVINHTTPTKIVQPVPLSVKLVRGPLLPKPGP